MPRELVRQGIAAAVNSGLRLGITNFHLLLAEAHRLGGASKEALEAAEQALQINMDEREYRPEALRIRGELRFNLGQLAPAERDFREAIALAQKMGAKAWELRATMSLAHLLAKLGRSAEARAMLAEIYGWFTEAFDTVDLEEAKAFLDELNERA